MTGPTVSLYKLILKEICYRKATSILTLISIIIAVSLPITLSCVIKTYQLQRDKIFEATFKEKEKLLREAEDKYRIATKKFGYNVLILPEGQNIEDFYADDYASKTMPETYVEKLANSKVLAVRHFLPTLTQKVHWPEGNRTIIIFGTSGEVPNIFKKPREPMMFTVKRGTAILGYYIYKNLKLKIGETVKLFGRTFTIKKLIPERGNKDDITIWINLKDAQEILNKPNKINAILALQCVCSGGDFKSVREEIKKVLPNVRVLGIDVRKIKSRAEIRATAAKLTKQALAKELETRNSLIKTLRKFMNILSPIVILTSALWISLLSANNVRTRKYEIGLLIALGTKTKTILHIFLSKAFFLGLIGAILSCGISFIFSLLYGIVSINIATFIIVLIITPALTILASLPSAIIAITTQPADVLHVE